MKASNATRVNVFRLSLLTFPFSFSPLKSHPLPSSLLIFRAIFMLIYDCKWKQQQIEMKMFLSFRVAAECDVSVFRVWAKGKWKWFRRGRRRKLKKGIRDEKQSVVGCEEKFDSAWDFRHPATHMPRELLIRDLCTRKSFVCFWRVWVSALSVEEAFELMFLHFSSKPQTFKGIKRFCWICMRAKRCKKSFETPKRVFFEPKSSVIMFQGRSGESEQFTFKMHQLRALEWVKSETFSGLHQALEFERHNSCQNLLFQTLKSSRLEELVKMSPERHETETSEPAVIAERRGDGSAF